MAQRMKLTIKDMETIKEILDKAYDDLAADLGTPAEKCAIIIPIVKISAMMEKEKAKLS
jgi:hypothetical protein